MTNDLLYANGSANIMRPLRHSLVAMLLIFTVGSHGTEGDPEVVDPAGDVEYDPVYVGAKDHDWLDVTGAWLEYRETDDVVDVVVRLVDGSGLGSPPRDWLIYCSLRGDVTADGENRGRLEFYASKPAGEIEFSSSVVFDTASGETVQGLDRQERLAHTYSLRPGEPGYHVFSVNVGLLRQVADEIRAFTVSCVEEFSPAVGAGLYANGDRAEAVAPYSFENLGRNAESNGSGVQDEGDNKTAGGQDAGGSASAASASVIGGVLAILAATAFGRRYSS